jgi:hypothetical protein
MSISKTRETRNRVKDLVIVALVIVLVILAWHRISDPVVAQHLHGGLPRKADNQKERSNESEFTRALAESLDAMHRNMSNAPQTREPDRDFLTTMIPHHQGAIDMSRIILLYGKDERLRRLAQGIIIEQQAEIEVMQRLLNDTDDAFRSRK